MAAAELIRIRINNWEKFNPRKDIKHPSWFRLENALIDDPDFYDFSALEMWAWIYILSISSKKYSADICLNIQHAERIGRIPPKALLSAIEKLKNLTIIQLLPVSATDTNVNVTPTNPTNERTDETNETNEQCFSSHWFEEVYKLYPITVKGENAQRRFEAQIKTPEDREKILKAIKNYLAMLALPQNSWRSPKQSFSAFLGTKSSGFFWVDYINWQPPPPTPATRDWTAFTDHVMASFKYSPHDIEAKSKHFGDDWEWVSQSKLLSRAGQMQDNEFNRKTLAKSFRDAFEKFIAERKP